MEVFYIWKSDPLEDLPSWPKWRGLYEDTWFVYEKTKGTITKTNCLFLDEVEQYIYKICRSKSLKRNEWQIIPAAPHNLASLPKVIELNYNEILNVENLDFSGLLEKEVLYVKSNKDEDVGSAENLYIDISYKKVLTAAEVGMKNRRQLLSDLRRKALSEYQEQYPNLDFRAYIIRYRTYEINPACFRSFEELYEDFERAQDNAMYDALSENS